MTIYKRATRSESMAAKAGKLSTYQLAQRLIDFGQTIILARLLTPAEFGVVSAAYIFIQFAQLVVEIGIGATIVQARELDRRDLRVAGTLVWLNSLFYFCLIQALAGPAGAFMKSAGVESAVRVLAFTFLFQAIGIVSESLMLREMEAARVARIQMIIKTCCSVALGIVMAATGWGFWSLIVPSVLGAIWRSAWLYAIVRQPLAPLFDRARARKLLRKGVGFSTSRVINFAAIRGDNTLVGHLFGTATLGIYARAYNLMNMPADLYGTIADKLVFPSLAKAQGDEVRVRAMFLKYVELTALIGLSLSAGLYILGREWILAVLGDRWTAVVAPFQILVVATYFRLGMKVAASAQRAAGAVRAMISTQSCYAVLVVGGCLVSFRYGLLALCVAVGVGVVITYGLLTASALRITGTSLRAYLQRHAPGFRLAVLTGALAYLAAFAGQRLGLPPILVLAVFGALLCLEAGLLLLARPRSLLGEVGSDLAEKVGRQIARRWKRSLRR